MPNSYTLAPIWTRIEFQGTGVGILTGWELLESRPYPTCLSTPIDTRMHSLPMAYGLWPMAYNVPIDLAVEDQVLLRWRSRQLARPWESRPWLTISTGILFPEDFAVIVRSRTFPHDAAYTKNAINRRDRETAKRKSKRPGEASRYIDAGVPHGAA